MDRRPDLDSQEIARLYLEGLSVMVLAVHFDTSLATIRRRLDKARTEFPDLSWDERVLKPTVSSTREFRDMNDGVPGESRLPAGSIIEGRRYRRP